MIKHYLSWGSLYLAWEHQLLVSFVLLEKTKTAYLNQEKQTAWVFEWLLKC